MTYLIRVKDFDGTEKQHSYHDLKVISQGFLSMLGDKVQRIGIYEYYGPNEQPKLVLEAIRIHPGHEFRLTRYVNIF